MLYFVFSFFLSTAVMMLMEYAWYAFTVLLLVFMVIVCVHAISYRK